MDFNELTLLGIAAGSIQMGKWPVWNRLRLSE